MELTCLSVRQPWAGLIVAGGKWCENRVWRTGHRGRLGIHASAKPDPEAPPDAATGAILGTAELVACLPVRELRDVRRLPSLTGRRRERAEGLARQLSVWTGIPRGRLTGHPSWEHVQGPHCWVLANPRPFRRPVPAKGRLRLWRHGT